MRIPSIVTQSQSSLGTDMPSIGRVKSPFREEDSDTTNDPDMELTNEKALQSSDKVVDKDSGIDSDNDLNRVIDSELLHKIVSQVEFYFSDENLIKDEFILKHIRRNRDGFISLKLLASFRKVKVLTKDWKLVAHCVRVGSKALELNDTETKIRRKAALPALEGNKYSRTIIAYNFIAGSDNIDNISKVFAQFGDIALIRIVKNSSSSVIPSNLLDVIKSKYDLKRTTVATIEYNNKSDAEKALKYMEENKRNNWRQSIEVMPMKSSNTKTNKTSVKCNENFSRYDKNFENRENQRNSFKMNYDLESNTNKGKKEKQIPVFLRQKSKSYSSGDESKVFNTIGFNQKSNEKRNSFHLNTNTNNCLKLSANVIRMPRGPDGTIGFTTTKTHRSYSEV